MRSGPGVRHITAMPETYVDFVAGELAALGIRDGRLEEVLRYEAVKLAAAALPVGASEDDEPPPELTSTITVGRARPYLIAAFATDIGSVIAGKPPAANDVALPQWVVFARQPSGVLDTMVISDGARRILECAQRPTMAGEPRVQP